MIHRTFTCIRIWKTLKTLTTLGSSGTKLLLPSWLLGFRHEEREMQFLLCWPFHLTQQMCGASRRPQTGLASSSFKSQLTAFFQKSPKILSPSLLGMTSFTSPSPISYPEFLLWHLWLTHPPHASVNTCTQCMPLPMH